MYSLLKPLLFLQDPEDAHDRTIALLKHSQRTPLKYAYGQCVSDSPVEFLGMRLPNPVGLAAGLDKNGECIDAFAAMGFGFIEVGTVTPRPQSGNPKPRLFRLPKAEAVINRMGFNNKGVDYLVEQVQRANYDGVLGINIGKNKDTPEEQALSDYLICLRKVYDLASYVTVNISSPNTPGLRNLQYGEALDALLEGLKKEQQRLAKEHDRYVPMLVKIAPDLDETEVRSIAASLVKAEIDGVIATNTTLDRESVSGLQHAEEAGGLSGAVLTEKSCEVTRILAEALEGKMPIVGVGGIHNEHAALERLAAGADVLQIYTGFIYHGPPLVRRLIKALAANSA